MAVVHRLNDGFWLGPVLRGENSDFEAKLVAVVHKLIDGLWLGSALCGEYCDSILRQS